MRDTYFCVCPPTHTGLVCQNAVTTPAPACPPSSSITNRNLGCQPAEVVFLIEYGKKDREDDTVDHEGDFIKEMIDHWAVNNRGMQVGVITYHDTVEEAIHIGSYSSPDELKDSISRLTKNLYPSGKPDLGQALTFAQNNSFQGARPNIPRVVIPIVHQMSDDKVDLDGIIAAAQALKDSCITVMPFGVEGDGYDSHTISQASTQPANNHMLTLDKFDDLEDWGEEYKMRNCAAVAPTAVVG